MNHPSSISNLLCDTLIQNLQGMFFRCNNDERMTMSYLSHNCVNITGYTAEELLNSNTISFMMMVHPVDHKRLFEEYIYNLEHHLPCNNEYRIICKLGRIRWVHEISTGVYDEAGKLLYIEGYIEEITAKKDAFSITSEYFSYQNAINAGSIVSMTDKKGKIYFANELFCTYSKYKREELLGQDHRIINSGYHTKEFFKDLWDTITIGKIWRGEIKNRDKEGKYYWTDTVITPIFDVKNEIIYFLSVRNIITDKKEIEEKLKESLALNRGILESIPSGIIVVDKTGAVIATNRAWEDFLAVEGNELLKKLAIGGNYLDACLQAMALGNIYAEQAYYGIKAVFNHEMPTFQMEYFYRSATKDYWFNLIITSYEGDSMKAVLLHEDITDIKNKATEIKKTSEDLSHRYNELMQFNYIVSHNLRSPIANILGMSNLINMPEVAEVDKQQCLEYINTSALKLDNVVKDLNQILETRSALNKKKVPINLPSLLNNILGTLNKQLTESGAVVNLELANEAHNLVTIKGYLESILYNLINNAIKYKSTRVPEIVIAARKEKDCVVITISDNGIGMDLVKNKDNLFGLYKRFNYEVEGKGLGLFMCKTQTEAIGGKISVESELNKGTVFTICLPIE